LATDYYRFGKELSGTSPFVIPGLDQGIHDVPFSWMAGPSPAMTV
jgi:hypothetical protein